MKHMSLKLKMYVLLIIVIGMFVLGFGIFAVSIDDVLLIGFFLILGIIAESAAIKINDTIWLSVSFAIGLATVMLFQLQAVVIVAFFSMIFSVTVVEGQKKHLLNTPVYKRLFNASAKVIGYSVSSVVFCACGNIGNLEIGEYSVLSIVIAVLSFAMLDLVIFSVLQSLVANKNIFKIILSNIHFLINVIAIAPIGIFIAIIYESYNWFAVLLFFGPLLLARYSFKLYVDMKNTYSETILALSNAVDAKDEYTNGHAHRVAEYAVGIAKQMNYGEAEIDKIKTASILHDIGKIGIDDSILNKPGKLEDSEFEEIKKHPTIGANILSQVRNLTEVTRIIKYHHERYEGGGYPEGLALNNVPIESYIISVADAFDAMTSDRPYRKAMEREKAISIIKEESGKQFHPQVVKAFVAYIESMETA